MVIAIIALATISVSHAGDACLEKTAEAWAICQSNTPADPIARMAALARGVAVAEAAVAIDPQSARAHFALFCNLAKQLELAGLSWRSLQRLARVKATLERALVLAPDDPYILAAKGEMLRQLPPLLGGDTEEAERLLRHAIERDPDHVAARLFLARLLVQDDRSTAKAEVVRAVALAERRGTPDDVAAARALVGALRR
jgi:cytochrome c-type biogenesis protein CcmH/NrfG